MQPANVLSVFYSRQTEEYNNKENIKLSPPLAKKNWDKDYTDLHLLNTQVYLFIFRLGSKSEVCTLLRIFLSNHHIRLFKVHAYW